MPDFQIKGIIDGTFNKIPIKDEHLNIKYLPRKALKKLYRFFKRFDIDKNGILSEVEQKAIDDLSIHWMKVVNGWIEAKNSNASPDRLRELFNVPEVEVKKVVLKNPNTPDDVLLKALEHCHESVVSAAEEMIELRKKKNKE